MRTSSLDHTSADGTLPSPGAVQTVLLSAAGSGVIEPPHVFGQPLIALQIRHLAQLGFTRFCIEVEAISENLVAAADALRKDGIDVSFVRGLAELRQAVLAADKVCVIANGIYCDPLLVSELCKSTAAAVPVFVNDADAAGFERIDRQHHWTGIALVEIDRLSELDELPEGWSLP